MEAKTPSSPVARSRGAARRSSVIALAGALLAASLFVDVGVARAEYPEGWQDPDLKNLSTCLITCATFFISKGPAAIRYGLAGTCASCAWDQFLEINDWMQANSDPADCWTGVLGNPCSDTGYPSR